MELVQAQKEEIAFKAFELFKRYGIRSITMDEVAGRCGISKKTLYQLFEDKDDLVSQMMAQHLNKTQCCLQQGSANAANAIEEVFQTLDFIRELFADISPVLFYDLYKYFNKAYKQFEVHKATVVFGFVQQNLLRGIEEGYFRKDLNVEIISHFHLHNMSLLFEQEFLPLKKFGPLVVQTEMTLQHLYGVSNSSGHKLIEKYRKQRQWISNT